MSKFIDLTGKRFYRKIVLGLHENRIGRHLAWKVSCDCGNNYVATTQSVRRGKHCEQCAYKGERPYRRKRPYEAQYNIFLGRARYPVTITYEQFLELTKEDKCHYCKAEIGWQQYRIHSEGSASNLDRKDNTKGYSLDNVVVCCPRCNYGKNRYFTYEEWVVMTRALAQLQKELEAKK